MQQRRVHIFGAGGLALCCLEIFVAENYDEVLMVDIEAQKSLDYSGVTEFFVAVGDNFKRHEVVSQIRAKNPKARFAACVHNSVIWPAQQEFPQGTYIGAGSIVGPDARIGEFCIINCGVIIEHESTVGDFVNIGTGSKMGGGAALGDRAILGVGVSINHKCKIGPDALVGSGATVVNDIPENCVALGTPAKAAKQRKFGDSFL